MFGYELIVIALMLVFNAIFAAYEMGLASISKARLAVLVSEKKKGAQEAAYMKDRMEASLAIVQVGITLVGALAAATAGAGVGEKFAPYLQSLWNIPEWLAKTLALIFLILPLTFITIVFAELVPKMIALHNKEWIVLRLSPTMKAISKIANPFISIIEIVVKKSVSIITRLNPKELRDSVHQLHEFKAAVSLARASKLIGARQEKIVLSAAYLSAQLVRDIVIPLQDISTLFIDSSLMDALLKAHLDMHTRFPVSLRENDPQSIEGYVNFKDIIVALKTNQSEPTIRAITRPIKKVNEDMSVSQLLEIMIQEKIHIVMVISRDGNVLGMITLEDIMEELVGEIEDEFDRLPTHIHPYGSAWIMGGGISMTVVASTLGLDWQNKFKDTYIPTLAEWCVLKIGHLLKGGEVIEADNLRVIPRKFRRKKISEAMVSVL